MQFSNSPTISAHRLRDEPSGRPYLVFIRAGAQPKPQPRWVSAAERNYDILASFYATPPEDCWLLGAADYVFSGGLSKFHAAQLMGPAYFSRYRGVWFIDDDLDVHFDAGAFLAFVDEQGFALAQPALTHHSAPNHEITLFHPTCIFRETNFVEVMAPCFSAGLLAEAIADFGASISTWGLDVAWGVRYTQRRLAVVDAFTMSHTTRSDRTNGPFYRYLRELGVDPLVELEQAFRRLGIERYDVTNLRFMCKNYPALAPSIWGTPSDPRVPNLRSAK